MMNKRLLALVLLLLGAGEPRGAAPSYGLVTGELRWTTASVCEWPPGQFLLDYVADGCGREVFFSGPGFPTTGELAGAEVWASGDLVRNGSCTILVVTSVEVCEDPDPDMERRADVSD